MWTFHMEQQNLPEGWNLVFKILFHSYSTIFIFFTKSSNNVCNFFRGKGTCFFHFYYISRGLKAHWTKNPKQFRNPFNFSIKFCCFESNFWPVGYKETFLLFFLISSGINEFVYYKYIWSKKNKDHKFNHLLTLITQTHCHNCSIFSSHSFITFLEKIVILLKNTFTLRHCEFAKYVEFQKPSKLHFLAFLN